MPKKYDESFRDRAVRMVLDRLKDDRSVTQSGAVREIAPKLGIGRETLRKWVLQSLIDEGKHPGVSTEESAEIRRLRRENAELRRANEILKTASAFFAAELVRPATR